MPTERRHPDGNERSAFKKRSITFKSNLDRRVLDCLRNLCRQDDGAPSDIPFFMNNESPKGWYSRGYLPHYDPGSVTQFITCRLFDSLPQRVLERFRVEITAKNAEDIDREMMILIEKFLDSGYGECFLKNRSVAEIVRDSLLKYHGDRYKLIAWVIMPNHIHLLLRPLNDWDLYKIMHSFKSFTAQEANKALHRNGRFWMREYFDRRIRDHEHFEKALRYIENNPVKARFCEKPSDWEFSSAFGTPSS